MRINKDNDIDKSKFIAFALWKLISKVRLFYAFEKHFYY